MGAVMKKYLQHKETLKNCHIAQMLLSAQKSHRLSFHTPGHKIGAEDITELAFSDNLSCPKGCIFEAERDIAGVFGAKKSFILTDGSTSGVLSMLYAVKALGAKKIAFPESSHKSVWNGCAVLGLTPLVLSAKTWQKIPLPATMYALSGENLALCKEADALLFTSPDYYGNVCDLAALRAFCDREKKFLLIDGAHGAHLHFEKTLHAGSVADLWVDGAHKSLPALTQGAVVSAKTERLAEKLRDGVDVFRTTSPSYPIMASVEYAVKYPRNERLENAVKAFQIRWSMKKGGRVYENEDWTKLCVVFGEWAFDVDKILQSEGVYCEFCDGNVIMFYLSTATTARDFDKLTKRLEKLFSAYPLPDFALDKETEEYADIESASAGLQTEWVDLKASGNRVCARNCGLFPPCVPLVKAGEKITDEHVALLAKADNVYGLFEGKICVYQSEKA